jgi:hypothetical protein
VLKRNLLKPEIPVSRRLPSLAVLGLLLLFSGVLLQAAGLPQDNQPQAKFSVKTYSTLMEVRVFDQFGNFVPSLQRNDFQVTVKSRPRELLSFKEEEKTPTSLAILIDIGSSMKEADIQTAKQAILDLIHLMPHDDELLLGVYDRDVDFLSSLTTDRPEVIEGLRNVSPSGRVGFWKRLSSAFGTDALTGSAIDEALLRLKSARYQNKVVLVFSAAFGNLGRGTEDHLREAGARLFAVGWKNSLGDAFNLWGDKTSQKELLKRSAGAQYSGREIMTRLDRLKTAMTSSYLLAYAPSGEESSDSDVEIRVKGHPDYRISSLRRTAGENAFY